MSTKRERTIPAGRFKAECLALLDEVARTGQDLVVTKRGRPVARLAPLEQARPPSLAGSVLYQEDLVAPIGVDWEADR